MKTLDEAMLCFQSKAVLIHKNARADRYTYADLPAVLDAITGPLTDCGIVLRQMTTYSATSETTFLVTSLIHVASGERINQELPLYIDEKPQSFGSRLTYYRRYSILTILGLSPEDDDGQAAMGQNAGYARQPEPPRQNHQAPYQERSQAPSSDLGACRDCGAPNKLSKAGRPYCSALCFKKEESAPQPQRPPQRRDEPPQRRDDFDDSPY